MSKELPGTVRIIGGKWRGRKLKVIPHSPLRPTSSRTRETLFNWLTPSIVNANCLDLYAGTGALGLEALSRGAAQVIFVESNRQCYTQLTAVIKQLDTASKAATYNMDALKYLQSGKQQKPFDIIFLDPPYDNTLLLTTLEILATSNLITADSLIFIESNKEIELNNWQVLKSKQAASVYFSLLKFGE